MYHHIMTHLLRSITRLLMWRRARLERNHACYDKATITIELSRRWDNSWQANATVTIDGKQYTGEGIARHEDKPTEMFAVWFAVYSAWSKVKRKRRMRSWKALR